MMVRPSHQQERASTATRRWRATDPWEARRSSTGSPARLDWLAADRVAVALMGIDLEKVGYLNYCAVAGMGETHLDRMEILGGRLSDHVRKYRLAD